MFNVSSNKILSIIVILCLVKLCKCKDYVKFKIEDIVIDFINKTYFDPDRFDLSVNYQYETNNMRMRFDIIHDLPVDLAVKMKVWDHAFGQYSVPTGISIDMNICTNKLNEFFFKTVFERMGLDKECPPKPGRYENEDFDPEIGGFPLQILPGFRFLIVAETYAGEISLVKVRAFAQVV